jgi:serine acetyltransferase
VRTRATTRRSALYRRTHRRRDSVFVPVIGASRRIGDNCERWQNVTVGGRDKRLNDGTDAMPVIGHNVTLCAAAVVIGPLRVGDAAIVGANAVVLRDVPEYTAVAGIPAVPVNKVDVPHAVRSCPARFDVFHHL